MRHLDTVHQCCVELIDHLQVFLTPTHLAIAMEYAQGGDLFNVSSLILPWHLKHTGLGEPYWL